MELFKDSIFKLGCNEGAQIPLDEILKISGNLNRNLTYEPI